MTTTRYTYHPLIILLYSSNMLTPEQVSQIPISTRYRWNKFDHTNYHFDDWCIEYIEQFEEIKKVYNNKVLFRGIKSIMQLSKGFEQVMQKVEQGNKILRENAIEITTAIKKISNYTKIPIKKAASIFGVNTDWYYRNRENKGCKASPLKKCFKTYTNQLSLKETTIIQDCLEKEENKTKTKTTLFYELANEGKLYCSKSTFFKYAKLFGFTKNKKGKKPRSKGFRATASMEWLHIDIMQVQTLDDGVQKVAFVKDNFSKAILNYKTTNGKAGSEFIKQLMEETYTKYKMYELTKDINIVTDGGPENKGAFLDWIENLNMPPIVRKLTAKTDEFTFPNNMSESTHRIYKSEFKQSKVAQNLAAHLKDLEEFIDYYNNKRYPTELYGYTPSQVLEGAIPDKHLFKEQRLEAKQQRIEENRKFMDCPVYYKEGG